MLHSSFSKNRRTAEWQLQCNPLLTDWCRQHNREELRCGIAIVFIHFRIKLSGVVLNAGGKDHFKKWFKMPFILGSNSPHFLRWWLFETYIQYSVTGSHHRRETFLAFWWLYYAAFPKGLGALPSIWAKGSTRIIQSGALAFKALLKSPDTCPFLCSCFCSEQHVKLHRKILWAEGQLHICSLFMWH